MEVTSVNLKVEPIQGEGLNEGENGFAIEAENLLDEVPMNVRQWKMRTR